MSDQLFVPAGFVISDGLTAEEFRLEPLGPQHNAADYAAWTASISHIQATPGFAGRRWPHQMSLAENLRDLGFWTGTGPLRTFAPAQGSPVTLSGPGPDSDRAGFAGVLMFEGAPAPLVPPR